MSAYFIQLSAVPIIAEPTVFADGEGAETQFIGVVRGEEDGRRISGIEYTAYRPMTDNELTALCERGQREHGLHRVEIRHRLEFVPAGEPSIIIRVRTKHSALSFDLCRWYLKEIKTSVPIWKKPVFSESCIDSVPSASTATETAAHLP
ncbi:MAG: molybdenum cofactor biosynthesis protein MoaE [Verrucomicrobiaceae bacterium]